MRTGLAENFKKVSLLQIYMTEYPYNDEYHESGSKLSYDGALIDAADAVTRYDRDERLAEKYEEAETGVEDLQMTWDDVKQGME